MPNKNYGVEMETGIIFPLKNLLPVKAKSLMNSAISIGFVGAIAACSLSCVFRSV